MLTSTETGLLVLASGKMTEIIKFPNTSEKVYVNGTKIAKEIEREKKQTEEFLNYRLNDILLSFPTITKGAQYIG